MSNAASFESVRSFLAGIQRRELQRYWRLRAKSGRTLTCALFGGEDGTFEVRTYLGDGDYLQRRDAPDLAAARSVAAGWLRVAMKCRPSAVLLENRLPSLADPGFSDLLFPAGQTID